MVLTGAAIAISAAVLAVLAAWLVNRRRGGDPGQAGQAVIESLKVIGSLFVICFAFVTVNALSDIDRARKNTYAEAFSLRQVYWAADAMAEADRAQIQASVRSYAGDVAAREWLSMKRGSMDEATWRQLDRLREQVGSLRSTNDRERIAQEEALGALRKVYEARGERVADVAEGLPDVMVWAMIVNGLLLLLVLIAVGFRQNPVQLTILGVVTAVMALGMFIVIELNHPFGDGISVSPEAFTDLLGKLSQD